MREQARTKEEERSGMRPNKAGMSVFLRNGPFLEWACGAMSAEYAVCYASRGSSRILIPLANSVFVLTMR